MMDSNKPFACDICRKSFKHKIAILNHRRIHTGERPYECEVCKKTFSQSSGLAGHVRVHTGENPYECEICKKTFSQNSHLADHRFTQVKSHMNVHLQKNIYFKLSLN